MSESGKSKIIVDEDWKSQVEREKQEALLQEASEQVSAEDRPNTTKPSSHEPEAAEGHLPPASFEVLVSSVATQVLAALGEFAEPDSDEQEIHLGYAKLQIDLLNMLEEKTQGNLDDAEKRMLEETLYQLRILFVSAQNAAK